MHTSPFTYRWADGFRSPKSAQQVGTLLEIAAEDQSGYLYSLPTGIYTSMMENLLYSDPSGEYGPADHFVRAWNLSADRHFYSSHTEGQY